MAEQAQDDFEDDPNWFDPAERERQIQAEEEAAVDVAVRKFREAFDCLRIAFSNRPDGHADAHWLMDAWLKQFKPPRKKKGAHNPELNAAILAAYFMAPDREKLKRAFAAAGAETDSAKRKIFHLVREQKKEDAKRAEALATYQRWVHDRAQIGVKN